MVLDECIMAEALEASRWGHSLTREHDGPANFQYSIQDTTNCLLPYTSQMCQIAREKWVVAATRVKILRKKNCLEKYYVFRKKADCLD